MFKQVLISTVCMITLILTGCGGQATEAVEPPLTSIDPTATAQTGAPAEADPPDTAEPTAEPAATQQSNKPYDPSIFIIEAAGSWREELAPAYFADYEVELYLHKIDPNDNRAVTGAYEGVFWMQVTLDAAGFISDLIGDAPVDIGFSAGGEAVSDNVGFFLNTSDDKAWVDYTILDDSGQALPLTQDTPVAKGSFVAVARQVYLDAKASGAQGEKLEFDPQDGTGDAFDVNYVIHVQPNSEEINGSRKVTIHLFGEGFSHTIEGTLRRIAGYPEDVSDYFNSPEYQNSTWSKLQ